MINVNRKTVSKPVSKSAKNQLAKLMAMENLTVIHKKQSTAWFDTEKRVLALPIWENMSNELYNLLSGHEVGHALETPNLGGGLIERICKDIDPKNFRGVKSFVNVVEDARIERMIKNRYPGLRRDFTAGYLNLLERNFFGLNGRDINTMKFIDRLNIYFKAGSAVTVNFSAEEMPYVTMVEKALTWDQVIAAVRTIYAFAKSNSETDTHKKPKNNKKEESEETEEGDDSGDSDDGDEDEEGDSGDEGDDSDDSEDESDGDGNASDNDGDKLDSKNEKSESETEGRDKNDEKKPETAEQSGTGDEGVNNPSPPAPISETDIAWEEKREDLASKTATDYVYLSIPSVIDSEKFIVDYKTVIKDFESWLATQNGAMKNAKAYRTQNNQTISFMVKEFEMRKAADSLQRTQVAKTGRINTNRLHTYQFNDDIFARQTRVTAGKNHGLVMFIDWSGSMQSNLASTIDQLINLVLFCKRVSIPFEVYAFSDNSGLNSKLPGAASAFRTVKDLNSNPKAGDITMGQLYLINFFSSRMNSVDFEKMVATLVAIKNLYKEQNIYRNNYNWPGAYSLNGTPLNDTVIVAMDIVTKFQKKNRVQIMNTIFLTDGGDNSHFNYYNEKMQKSSSKYSNNVVLRDNLTRAEYITANHTNYNALCMTALKERTGSNLVGFYITSGGKRNASVIASMFFPTDYSNLTTEKVHEEFSKNKFVVSTHAGYDELYVIKDTNLNVEEKALDITGKNTVAQITREFMKHSNNKTSQRVILQKFIAKIA